MGIMWEASFWVFFFLTVLLGGGAAWMAGRALALGWQPFWKLMFFMALFGFVVRFFHYALFQETLLSPQYYFADTLVLVIAASLGFRLTRTTQMVRQYSWLYRRTSPLSWTKR